MDLRDWHIVRSTPIFEAMSQEVAQSITGAQPVRSHEKQSQFFRQGATTSELPYEKSLTPNRLGMKPESFSRALVELRPLGIGVARELVTVADVLLLVRLAEAVDREDEGF